MKTLLLILATLIMAGCAAPRVVKLQTGLGLEGSPCNNCSNLPPEKQRWYIEALNGSFECRLTNPSGNMSERYWTWQKKGGNNDD